MKRLIKLLIGGLTLFSLLLLSILAVLCVILFFSRSGDGTKIVKESHTYRFFEFDPHTKVSSVGFIEVFTQLENGKFLSYEDEDEKKVLISDFGLDEYKCTGKCACVTSQNERRVSAVISRTLIYLLAASSTLVAFNLARNHFHNECSQTIENDCPSNAIMSEVDDCEKVHKDVKIENGKASVATKRFLCKGTCLNTDTSFMLETGLLERENFDSIAEAHEGKLSPVKCSELQMSSEVVVDSADFLEELKIRKDEGIEVVDSMEFIEFAKFTFSYGELHTFCEQGGMVTAKGLDNFSVCTGVDFEMASLIDRFGVPLRPMRDINPTVECVEKID